MKIKLLTSAPASSRDLLIVGTFEKELTIKSLSAEKDFVAGLREAVRKKRFSGASGEVFSTYSKQFKYAPEIVVVGLGKEKEFNSFSARKAAGQIVKQAKERKAQKILVDVSTFAGGAVKPVNAAGYVTEVSLLAAYDFNKYKAAVRKNKTQQQSLDLWFSRGGVNAGIRSAVRNGEILAGATAFTRDLINEPANVLNATELARRAKAMAAKSGLSCRIMKEPELKKLKMGGVLGVNQGSTNPPAFIVLEHGKRYQKRGTVCLVGKGVTFDTGGLSIKPAKGMEKMKYDMSGAAGVLGAMKAIAELKLPVHVVSLTPSVENNVSNNPIRPGDILKMYNGKTVEVLNTDAEGRLILADALAYAERYKPKALIDMATLTGMCVYTFGDQAIGLMGNDEKLVSKLKAAGLETGERCWELPIWEEYRQQILGKQSDLQNIGGMYGGTITAAMFLKEFVPAKTSWAHLDIAGTAWSESGRFDCALGATGVGVRLLTELVSSYK